MTYARTRFGYLVKRGTEIEVAIRSTQGTIGQPKQFNNRSGLDSLADGVYKITCTYRSGGFDIRVSARVKDPEKEERRLSEKASVRNHFHTHAPGVGRAGGSNASFQHLADMTNARTSNQKRTTRLLAEWLGSRI